MWLSGNKPVSMRMKVLSLASLNGLRILHSHELPCRSQMRLRSCGFSSAASALIQPLVSLEVPQVQPQKIKRKKKQKTLEGRKQQAHVSQEETPHSSSNDLQRPLLPA